MKSALVLAIAATLAACGGGGSSSGDRSARSFTGSWSGTYVPSGKDASTAVTVTALPSADDPTVAQVNGGTFDDARGRSTIVGKIVDGGGTTLTLTFGDGGTVVYQGTSRVDGQGRLRSNLAYDDGGTRRTAALILDPVVISTQ